MVSLVQKIKKIYKGSYFYANRKYGKYTKRRPFPNFNDFDCSPSGDFSMNEVPAEMNVGKPDIPKDRLEKSSSYITVVNEGKASNCSNCNYTSNVSTPVNSIIFEKENKSNNVSPVTVISDNTDSTVVNNPFYSFNEVKQNPVKDSFNSFYEANESTINTVNTVNTINTVNTVNTMNTDRTFVTKYDGMNYTSNVSMDYYAKELKNNTKDGIKMEYNDANNWKVEIKRYYSSMPQTNESNNYNSNTTYNYNDRCNRSMQEYDMGMGMGMDMKKKSKWWKKIVPKSKSQSSSFSDNTLYDNNDNDYDSKRYYSKEGKSYYSTYDRDYKNNTYGNNKNNYSYYNSSLTDGVLVVNPNAKVNSMY